MKNVIVIGISIGIGFVISLYLVCNGYCVFVMMWNFVKLGVIKEVVVKEDLFVEVIEMDVCNDVFVE